MAENQVEHSGEDSGKKDTFTTLQNEILNMTLGAEPLSPELEERRKSLIDRRNRIVERAASKGFFTLPYDFREEILSSLKESTWDNYRKGLVAVADYLEHETQKLAIYEPEWEGLARAAVLGTSERISVEGFERMRGRVPDYDRWLWEHGMNAQRLQEKRKLLSSQVLLDFEINPADYVGMSVSKRQAAQDRVAGATERVASRVEKEEPEIIRLEPEDDTPEAWMRLVFDNMAKAEAVSAREGKKSDENGKLWLAIERAIDRVPERLGTRDSFLSRFLAKDYPEGVWLKEKLKIYYQARKNLNDRFVEIVTARGSMAAMGLGSEEIQLKTIKYTVHEVQPIDWWMLIHGDEVFRPDASNLADKERREMLADVDRGLCTWWDIGRKYTSLPLGMLNPQERAVIDMVFGFKSEFDKHYAEKDKGKKRVRKLDLDKLWPTPQDFYDVLVKTGKANESDLQFYLNIPTFKNSLNSNDVAIDLKARAISESGSHLGEELAYRLLTVGLTVSMFDRQRASTQGKSEDRDLMWGDTKRIYDFGTKEREPGVDWTIGRYFADPDQEFGVKEAGWEKSRKLVRRREKLAVNSERSVFVRSERWCEGELISSFLHIGVGVPDALKPGDSIQRKLISYAVDASRNPIRGGWKKIPFLAMGPMQYSGYFGYNVNIATIAAKELYSTTWQKVEELADPTGSWWENKRGLFDRLAVISPWLNTLEFDFRGKQIRDLLSRDSRFSKSEINTIVGYSDPTDLNGITDPGLRALAHQIVAGERKTVLESEKLAKQYTENQIHKIRMIHALGVVWPGSLDALEETGGLTAGSAITPDDLNKIIRGIVASRYLTGDYLKQFMYEVEKEMGFGAKWYSDRVRRYRNP